VCVASIQGGGWGEEGKEERWRDGGGNGSGPGVEGGRWFVGLQPEQRRSRGGPWLKACHLRMCEGLTEEGYEDVVGPGQQD
jgi:hypothetical protein